MVCGLWVTPDFTEVNAGRIKPPRVNHSEIDFGRLATVLEETFTYGPPVTIQVPNDTIDQVTVHFRENTQAIRCADFGKALLSCAKKSQGQVIDVRQSWQKLHWLSDRDFAPPPSILPFVVTAYDFEDAMVWMNNARPSIGLRYISIMDDLDNTGSSPDYEGSLPDSLRLELGDIFGTPFEKRALMSRIFMQKPPRVYDLSQEE
jgi:hypothetical protein